MNNILTVKKPKFFTAIVVAYLILPFIMSCVSAYSVIEFFNLSHEHWLAIILALAFECGSLAALLGLVNFDKTNAFLLWVMFILLTAFQCHGNIYCAYNLLTVKMQTNPHLIDNWCQLWGMTDMDADDIIYAKRTISYIAAGIIPLISLGFLHFLTTYLKKTVFIKSEEKSDPIIEQSEKKTEVENEPITKNETIVSYEGLTPDFTEADSQVPENKEVLVSAATEIKKDSNVVDYLSGDLEEKQETTSQNNGTLQTYSPTYKKIISLEEFPVMGINKKEAYLKLLNNLFNNGAAKIQDELDTFGQFKKKCENDSLSFSIDVYKEFLTICNFLQITDLQYGKRTALVDYNVAVQKLSNYIK